MTSLYAYHFALLPPPPRSVFSLGSESTRAVLPDFANVEQLRQFVERLHVYRMDDIPGTFIQFKVGASFVCALILIVMAIIARRMYDRSFWILRLMKRPSGRILIPNAMLSFACIQGLFGAVFVALMWFYCDWFGTRARLPVNPLLWLGMTWCPLITGAWWAAVGTYWATPSSNQSSFGVDKLGWLHTFFSHAWTINTLGLLCPFIISASVLGPALVSDRAYEQGLRMGQAWQAQYAQQDSFSEPMVQDAQRVWFQAIQSMRTTNILFIVWTFWAIVMCASYSCVAWRLVSSIHKELQRRLHTPVRMFGIVTTHVFNTNVEEPSVESNNAGEVQHTSNGAVKGGHHSNSNSNASTDAVAKPEASKGMYDIAPETNKGETDKRNKNDVEAVKPPPRARTDAMLEIAAERRRRLAAATAEIDLPRTGVRRLVPNIMMQKNAAVIGASTTSRSSQLRELRKAFVHICIQFCAISPACAVMAGIALLLAVTSYGATEQPSASGGTRYEDMLAIALVWVTWTICLFGGITVTAIAQRTYEPVFQAVHFSSSGGGDGSQSHSSERQISGGSDGMASPTRRHSKRGTGGVGRLLGRHRATLSGGTAPAAAEQQSVDHAMSTFFETQTRNGRRPYSQQTSLGVQRQQSKRSNHTSRSALHEYEHEGMPIIDDHGFVVDVERDGMFVEHTILSSVQEHPQFNGARRSIKRKDVPPRSPTRQGSESTTATLNNYQSSSTSGVDKAEAAGAAVTGPAGRRARGNSSPQHMYGRTDYSGNYSTDDEVVEDEDDEDEDHTYFRGGTGRQRNTSSSSRVGAPTQRRQERDRFSR